MIKLFGNKFRFRINEAETFWKIKAESKQTETEVNTPFTMLCVVFDLHFKNY